MDKLLEKRIAELRARTEIGAKHDGRTVFDGVEGWAYYVTFPETSSHVTAQLVANGWEIAPPEHKPKFPGIETAAKIVWMKPQTIVEEEIAIEAKNRVRATLSGRGVH